MCPMRSFRAGFRAVTPAAHGWRELLNLCFAAHAQTASRQIYTASSPRCRLSVQPRAADARAAPAVAARLPSRAVLPLLHAGQPRRAPSASESTASRHHVTRPSVVVIVPHLSASASTSRRP